MRRLRITKDIAPKGYKLAAAFACALGLPATGLTVTSAGVERPH
jgi:hypothetical protein